MNIRPIGFYPKAKIASNRLDITTISAPRDCTSRLSRIFVILKLWAHETAPAAPLQLLMHLSPTMTSIHWSIWSSVSMPPCWPVPDSWGLLVFRTEHLLRVGRAEGSRSTFGYRNFSAGIHADNFGSNSGTYFLAHMSIGIEVQMMFFTNDHMDSGCLCDSSTIAAWKQWMRNWKSKLRIWSPIRSEWWLPFMQV